MIPVLAATVRPADYQGVSHGKEAAPANTTQESRDVVKKLAEEFRKAAG